MTTLAAAALSLLLAWPPVAGVLTHAVDPFGTAEKHVKEAVQLSDAPAQADQIAVAVEEAVPRRLWADESSAGIAMACGVQRRAVGAALTGRRQALARHGRCVGRRRRRGRGSVQARRRPVVVVGRHAITPHSCADAGDQAPLLSVAAIARAARRATRSVRRYGRDRYIYSFIVSIVLFSVGGLFALYEAYHKFDEIHSGHGEAVEGWKSFVPVVVLVVAIGLESFSLRTAIIETNKVRGDASFAQFVRRAKSPELPVILLEDVAAPCWVWCSPSWAWG